MARLRQRLSRWGVALRIATRDARQNGGRTSAAIVLIALPIIVAIGAVAVWDVTTSQRYVASEWLGRDTGVQAVATHYSSGPIHQDATNSRAVAADSTEASVDASTLSSWVPDQDSLTPVDSLYQLTLTSSGASTTVATATQTPRLDVPVLAELGRSGPLDAGKIVISQDLATQLGVGVGDSVELGVTVEQSRLTKKLTGTAVVDALVPGERRAVAGAGTLGVDPYAVAGKTFTSWYVTGPVPIGWDKVEELNASGFRVTSRAVLASPPPASQLSPDIAAYAQPSRSVSPWQYLLIVAGILLVLTEMILLVSPLFTVTQRSVMRTAAMIVANGGDNTDGRRLTIAHGLTVGLYAAMFSVLGSVGVLLGIGHWSRLGIGIIPWWTLVLSLLLPLMLSIMASVSPAHTSAHINTSAVIGGRTWEPSRLVRRRLAYPVVLLAALPILGIAAWQGQIGLLILGIALLETGLIGSIPYLFMRWRSPNRRSSMSMRLALRDAVRNGHRTFPAMASILTTVFVACALLITLNSSNEAGWNATAHVGARGRVFVKDADMTESVLRTRQVHTTARDAIASVNPVVSEVTLTGMAWNSAPGGPTRSVGAISPIDGQLIPQITGEGRPIHEVDPVYIVDDGTYLRESGIVSGDEMVRAVTTLTAGGVLVPEPSLIDGTGQVRLSSLDLSEIAKARAAGQTSNLPFASVIQTVAFKATPFTDFNVVVLSPQAASQLGLAARPLGQLLTVQNPIGPFSASAFTTQIAREAPGASVTVLVPSVRSVLLPYIAAFIAVVAAGATVALVVALSASDMRPDLDTLDAIGAGPSMRRHVTTWQGLVLALNCIPAAVLSGLIVGVLAVLAVARSQVFPELSTLTPVIPWSALIGMLVGMPALCGVVAIVLTPRGQKRLRRID